MDEKTNPTLSPEAMAQITSMVKDYYDALFKLFADDELLRALPLLLPQILTGSRPVSVASWIKDASKEEILKETSACGYAYKLLGDTTWLD